VEPCAAGYQSSGAAFFETENLDAFTHRSGQAVSPAPVELLDTTGYNKPG
jgi:hypothetical protein